jgi:hypothetical protein
VASSQLADSLYLIERLAVKREFDAQPVVVQAFAVLDRDDKNQGHRWMLSWAADPLAVGVSQVWHPCSAPLAAPTTTKTLLQRHMIGSPLTRMCLLATLLAFRLIAVASPYGT